MAQDLLNTYKYGWKTSYYQNTYDAKKDIDEPSHPVGWKDEVKEEPLQGYASEILTNKMPLEEEDCDSCTI